MSNPDQMVREVVWKITPPMSRKSTFTDDPEEVAFIRKSPGYTITEYLATPEHPAGDAIRDAALEAAAKVCDDYAKSLDNEWNRKLGYTGHEDCTECADAIRALRGRAG